MAKETYQFCEVLEAIDLELPRYEKQNGETL